MTEGCQSMQFFSQIILKTFFNHFFIFNRFLILMSPKAKDASPSQQKMNILQQNDL
jgi:hypothetical protein